MVMLLCNLLISILQMLNCEYTPAILTNKELTHESFLKTLIDANVLKSLFSQIIVDFRTSILALFISGILFET